MSATEDVMETFAAIVVAVVIVGVVFLAIFLLIGVIGWILSIL